MLGDAPQQPLEAICRRAIWQLVQALASQRAAIGNLLAPIEDLHQMILALDRRLTRMEQARDDAP